MLKLEQTEVFGWEAAIRGMRNPKNSWDRSDTFCGSYWHRCHECPDCQKCARYFSEMGDGKPYRSVSDSEFHYIGPNDHKLMMQLASGGPVHAKFRRMIVVTVDITAPLYWWKEFDTYKVGTVANSCSTMHKLTNKPFEMSDFSTEHLDDFSMELMEKIIHRLNANLNEYLEWRENDPTAAPRKDYWWQMIQLLPTSYNQKRTVMLNYEVLAGLYPMRKDHKLDEWHTFCDWIKDLPYSEVIIGQINNT